MEMELKDFVSETLKQIIDGVKEAQAFAKEKGAVINPTGAYYPHFENATGIIVDESGGKNYYIPQTIEFDIAVTVSETDKDKGGLGIIVMGFGGGGVQKQTEFLNSKQSRIKFSLLMGLPPQITPF